LVLWVTDGSATGIETKGFDKNAIISDTWLIRNKSDLLVDKLCISSESSSAGSFLISATSGAGMDRLIEALSAYTRDYFAATEASVVTRARHRRALEETVAALDRALAQDTSGSEELIAEELRVAAATLGRLTGRIDVEDILDVIFREFCIGK
jgi:tRNA modification GTPase